MLLPMKQIVALVVLLAFAVAAPLQEVEVVGVDPVLGALARVALPFGVGDEPGDLEAARKAVLETGYFKDAKLRIENNKLIVELVANPPIAEVTVDSAAQQPKAILRFLENEYAIGPGATYNPVKLAEATAAISAAYREGLFPFAPKVTFSATETDKGMKIAIKIDESPEVSKIEVGPSSYVPRDRLLALAELIPENGRFSAERYQTVLEEIRRLYEGAGYRGSGVDLAATILEGGTLKLTLQELKISEIIAPGFELADLGVKAGDPFNVDKLIDGINVISRKMSRVVNFRPELVGPGAVRITLEAGAERYGVIKEVKLEGASVIPNDKLIASLKLRPGDEYNPNIAAEDFSRLVRIYGESGYAVLSQPEFTFKDGVYQQRVREVKIAGYIIEPSGLRTQPEVILRELPKVGSVLSGPALLAGISRILQAGVLAEPPRREFLPGKAPDEVIVKLTVKENRFINLLPTISWSSIEGWSGVFSIKDTNLWGLAHTAGLEVSFGQNDAHDNFSFGASYTVPWLYIDFADFMDVRTNVALEIYSRPRPNNDLKDTSDQKTGWQYSERRTGISFSIGRPLSVDLPNLRFTLALGYESVVPKLEVYDPTVVDDANSNLPVNDPNRYKCKVGDPTTCTGTVTKTLPEALALLGVPYETLQVKLGTTYSSLDNPRFPTQGYAASAELGYGLSLPQGQPLTQFVPLSATGKAFFRLDEEARQAFAIRLSAGQIFGEPPASQRFSIGGNGTELNTLRGYDNNFKSGVTLLSSSVEYRYDFRLSPQGGTNIYGFVFGDLAGTWGVLGNMVPALYGGIGFGVQVELDLLGFLLPPFRFEYGFSPQNPSGILHFRLGATF